MTKQIFKTKTFIIIAAAVVIAAIGFAAGMLVRTSLAANDPSNYIGADQAKQIALESVGVTNKNATFTKVEIDQDQDTPYYELEFYTSACEYEFEVEALTGTIAHKESRDLLPMNKNSASSSGDADTANSGLQQNEIQSNVSNANNSQHHEEYTDAVHHNDGHNVHEYIGVSRAKEAALHHARVSADHARFTDAELDTDDGRRIYEIDFISENTEYEYDIDAKTGEVLFHETEPLDHHD